MSMVIHHGGAGTTAFGLRAGVPSCALPFVFDQFFWGERIAQLGAGPDPLPYKKLTVERLRAVIEMGVNNPTMRQNAFELGEKIQKENGIESAIGIIEKIIRTA
jgi:UDP:flavonoid glycosyltransferase YjiC (YdhE family)